MDLLPNWEALQHRIGVVPRDGPGYTSNLYASRQIAERWCAAGQVRSQAGEGAVLVLRADRDFHRVHHVARDPAALAATLAMLPAGRYVTDLVGRGDALERVCDAYRTGGFAHHAFLRRMRRAQGPEPAAGEVALARADEAPAVAAFLDRLLDPLAEQLPDLAELREAADAGRLLLVRQGAAIAGMLMYDLNGQVAHLRFWHVDRDARGAGVGRQMMAAFLSRCAQARQIVLWVIGDNERSIAIYRHYGFEPDGLLDRIMTSHKDQHR